MSDGTRSGVNCRRANVPPTTFATVSTASVFATPGHALEQQVPAGEQADEHPLDQPVLPDDHPLDLEDGALEALAFGGRARHGILRAHARIQHGPR